MHAPAAWKPLSIDEVQRHLGGFVDWTLCGGCSVDLLLGGRTRSHTDIDIGVFRSQLRGCLEAIGAGRVFLFREHGVLMPWDGKEVNAAVHDIWISDPQREFWVMQIMVFDDDGDEVVYRRDRRIRWPKRSHYVRSGTLRVLNPFITFLYKASRLKLEEKDILDIAALITTMPNVAAVCERDLPLLTSNPMVRPAIARGDVAHLKSI